ncbi:MAG: hypothetical protein ABJC36_05315 [Gemmatimonadales bacterium]
MIRAACRSAVAFLFVVSASAACSSWHVQPLAPEQLLGERPPSAIRVKLQNSTRLVLERPHLAGDSVTGTSKGRPATLPLTGIAEIAVRRFSPVRTAGFVAGGIASLFAVAVVVCAAEGGCVPNFQGFSLGY